MRETIDSIQIIELDSPYDTLSIPLARRTFLDIFSIKLAGYREIYPYGVLPLDTYDFISTHHLICQKRDIGFTPLMAFRTITLEKCQTHRLPFPGLAVLRNSGATEHAAVLEAKLAHWAKEGGGPISYGSSWALEPSVRGEGSPEFRALLKEIMIATLVNYEQSIGVRHLLACGVPKVHTDLFFEKLGYGRVEKDGFPLPPFSQASLIGEEAVLLHAPAFNAHALSLAERHLDLWQARKVLSLPADTAASGSRAA